MAHDTDQERPRPADYRRFSDTVREQLDGLEQEFAEHISRAGAKTLVQIFDDLPPLPLTTEARFVASKSKGDQWLLADMDYALNIKDKDVVTHAMRMLDNANMYVVTVLGLHKTHTAGMPDALLRESFYKKAEQVAQGGKYQPTQRRLAKELTIDKPDYTQTIAPAVLLHTATMLLLSNAHDNLRAIDPTLTTNEQAHHTETVANEILQAVCAQIIAGETADRTIQPPRAADRAIKQTLLALEACYNIGESDEDKLAIIKPLILARVFTLGFAKAAVPKIYQDTLRQDAIGTTHVYLRELVAPASKRVVGALQKTGIDISDELVDVAIEHAYEFTLSKEHVEATLRDVNVAHSMLRTRHVARALMTAIADGSLKYASLQFLTSTRRAMRPFALRAESVQAEHEAKQAKRREREASILEEIERAAEALDWEILRPGETGETREHFERVAPTGEGDNERLEPLRMEMLITLRDAWPWPGATICSLKLSNKIDKTKGKKKPRKHKYYAVILPKINDDDTVTYNVVSTCAERGNGAFAARSDMYDGLQWKKLLDDDKDHAVANGAIKLRHPNHADYEADPDKTIAHFADRAFELFAISVEEFWARWLAQAAVAGAVKKPNKAE